MSEINELERLAKLRESGAITDDEFQKVKYKLLNNEHNEQSPKKKGFIGTILKALAIFFVVFIALGIYFSYSKPTVDPISLLENEIPEQINPQGELGEMFSFGSTNTDIQRDNKINEIKGKVISWSLPVFEVNKDGTEYRIQTSGVTNESGNKIVGTFIYITPKNQDEKTIIEGLKTGDYISFKGRIKDVSMRNLEISPAVLLMPINASSDKTKTELMDKLPVATELSQSKGEVISELKKEPHLDATKIAEIPSNFHGKWGWVESEEYGCNDEDGKGIYYIDRDTIGGYEQHYKLVKTISDKNNIYKGEFKLEMEGETSTTESTLTLLKNNYIEFDGSTLVKCPNQN